jgi:hypothetical protein
MNRVRTGLLAVMLLLAGSGQVKAELVTNGGFETGNFNGWTQSGNTSFTFVTTFNVHSGNYAAALGPVASPGYLRQILNTTPGTSYTISFALNSDGLTPNFFSAAFGSQTLLTQNDIPATNGYHIYTFNATATSALTTLAFGFRNDPGYLRLDDVHVNPRAPVNQTPEPGSLALLGMGAIGLAGYGYRRRKGAPPKAAHAG